MSKKSIIYKGCMVLFDIFAVNFSYFLAFFLRFYIAYEFRGGAKDFIQPLIRIMPLYTIACICIFAAFKMYRVLWKVAGLRDLNRLAAANAVAAAVFIVGSLLSRNRMPLSMYFIGPCMQLILITLSRLGIKLILMERDHLHQQRNATGNAMVIGTQYLGQAGINQIDHSDGFITKCIIDTRSTEKGRFQNGIPVIGGTNNIETAIDQYQISYVLIADTFISNEERQNIKNICKEKKITVADYTGYIENGMDTLSITRLLQDIDGKVIISYKDNETEFESSEDAMQSITGRRLVKKISVSGNSIRIEIVDNPLIPNDTNKSWVEEYKKETGDDVSFF